MIATTTTTGKVFHFSPNKSLKAKLSLLRDAGRKSRIPLHFMADSSLCDVVAYDGELEMKVTFLAEDCDENITDFPSINSRFSQDALKKIIPTIKSQTRIDLANGALFCNGLQLQATAEPDREYTLLSAKRGKTTTHYVEPIRLAELISAAIPHCDPDNSRYALGGVYFEFADGELNVVATDGKRLFHGAMKVISESREMASWAGVVPLATCKLLLKACKLSIGMLGIAIVAHKPIVVNGVETTSASEHIEFCMSGRDGDRIEILSLLVEGRFPRWRDVLPAYHSDCRQWLLSTEACDAFSQAAKITTEDSRDGLVVCVDKTIGIEYRNPVDGASFQACCEARPLLPESDGRKVCLDLRYCAQACNLLGWRVEMHIIDENKAVSFISAIGQIVVMPMEMPKPVTEPAAEPAVE